ncbi:hypothetical protein [Halococcoides cellulosivorans]|uniref:Uncharacterized protein n=1 Tax=Halococcoides cellulosivorans TaxID=1679096 RepID=A0A2R4X3J8_9EURY|nr:hypothetical protein [Halococcoides cellulosivorans]AWB28370.1 hypothetical protein HARCEL1_11960 [Halococcoides cellulosivorans]
MSLFSNGVEDDDRTMLALSVAALMTLGATLFLGDYIFNTRPGTTEPALAMLFSVTLIATGVIGMGVWAVSPIPGKTLPLFAIEAEDNQWRVPVVLLAMAALVMFGTAAYGINSQFVARPGPTDTLSLVNIGLQLSGGTVIGARVLITLYYRSRQRGRE